MTNADFRQLADQIEREVSAASGGMDGWTDLVRRAAFKGLVMGYRTAMAERYSTDATADTQTTEALKERHLEETELEELRAWASKAHGDQKYDSKPYSEHLKAVEAIIVRYGHHFKGGDMRLMRRCAWLHDVLEDTSVSFDQLRSVAGAVEASLVQLVTDEPGVNRKERKSKTYPKIRTSPLAIALKLADRIANVENARETKYSLINMYKKEHPDFRRELYRPDMFNDMWGYLDGLLV